MRLAVKIMDGLARPKPMADLRNIRPRPGVRITLHPADIADIVTQPDVLICFSDDELEMIEVAVTAEQERRLK